MICPVPLPFHFSELFRFRNGSHRTAVAATAMTRIRLHPISISRRMFAGTVNDLVYTDEAKHCRYQFIEDQCGCGEVRAGRGGAAGDRH